MQGRAGCPLVGINQRSCRVARSDWDCAPAQRRTAECDVNRDGHHVSRSHQAQGQEGSRRPTAPISKQVYPTDAGRQRDKKTGAEAPVYYR